MTMLRYHDGQAIVPVSRTDPLPTSTTVADARFLTVREMMERNIDWYGVLTGEGNKYYASGAAANTAVTGQTSFANTTATFMLDVPNGAVCVPTLVALGQTGTVAGDAISVLIVQDNATRFSSGTALTVYNSRTRDSLGGGSNDSSLVKAYHTATVTNAAGIRVMGITVAQDVAPAEGISNEIIWTPTGPDFLVGPAAFLIYTYAGTTGPTWFPTLSWLEFETPRFGF